MTTLKVVEVYDGRLPEYQVLREIIGQPDQLLKAFDTREEADTYCKGVLLEEASTPCGEEGPG